MKRRKGKIVAGFAGVVVAVLIGVCWPQLVAWYKFLSLFESIGKNEQGYPEYRHRQTGIIMVRVPGGRFWMGSAKEEEEHIVSEYARYVGRKRSAGAEYAAAEQPRHQVTVGSFLIAKYELRQSVWLTFIGSNDRFRLKGDDLPATSLSWDDCRDFCAVLVRLDSIIVSARVGRLYLAVQPLLDCGRKYTF